MASSDISTFDVADTDLPWPVTKLSEAGTWGSGGTPRRGTSGFYGGHIPWLKIGDLVDGPVGSSEESITELALKQSSAKVVPAGTLLVAMYGSIGKLGIAAKELATNQAIAHCQVNVERFDTEFLFFYLLAERSNLLNEGKGGTQSNISQTVLKAYPLPEPDPTEQRRIVAVLKEALADVREAKEALERVPGQMKQFRQSVLAQAFRGELTADWRGANADRFRQAAEWFDQQFGTPEPGQPASTLTAAQLATIPDAVRDWLPGDRLLLIVESEGRAARQLRRAGVETEIIDGIDYEELPEEWTRTRVGRLIEPGRDAAYGVLQPGGDLPHGAPMVRVCDIHDGCVAVDQLKKIDLKIHQEYRRTWLRGGEVLVTLVGTIGRTAVAPSEVAGANIARAVGMLPMNRHVLPRFGQLALEEPSLNGLLVGLAREVARKTLNLGLLKAVEVPLASVAEQREVVARNEALFAEADATEATATTTLANLRRLQQSTLQSAFRGEL